MRRSLIIVGVLICLGVIGIVYRSISVSFDAEHTLHAYYATLDVVTEYVSENPGQWPRSWEDLETVTPSEEWTKSRWPHDMPEIRKRIEIDFTLNIDDVIGMDPENFSAIRQIGPNYGPHEGRIKHLQETASH